MSHSSEWIGARSHATRGVIGSCCDVVEGVSDGLQLTSGGVGIQSDLTRAVGDGDDLISCVGDAGRFDETRVGD